MSSHVARPSALAGLAGRRLAVPAAGVDAAIVVALGGLLAVVAFAAQGGLLLGRTTKVELALLLGSGAVVAVSALAAPARRGLAGAATAALFAALAVWTVASIGWAVQPSDAWIESGRTLTYLAVFVAGIAAVRLAPQRWPAVLGAIVLGAVVVCGYALLTKVLPGALNPDELYARLRAPYGYWNAVGLTAALAIPPCLWLGARRDGHGALNALALPAVGVLLVALLLAYSRGALLALVVGGAFWFAAVPLRLRAAAVLIPSALGAGLVVAWDFSQGALSQDRVPLALRAEAGHRLGLLLIALVLGLTAVGLLAGFAREARPLRPLERRRLGAALLCTLALVPVAVVIGLAQTQRGLGGSVSHGWHALTDPNASSPSNAPGRLTSVGSVRARYWSEALRIWRDHQVKGVGAGGYATVRPRYRRDNLDVLHAHGYAVQTLADLGLVGAALSLLALVAWAVAAARAAGLRRRGAPAAPFGPERVGLLTMASVVVVFGVHSFVDWTWFVPGNAIVALLCAGWVAGRGRPDDAVAAEAAPAPARPPRAWLADGTRAGIAVAAIVVALACAWSAWQPLRSLDASNDAFAALARGDLRGAKADAQAAHARNPLALDPLTALAISEARAGHRARALAAIRQEVRLQPANPEAWLRLGDIELNELHDPRAARRALSAALYLNPRDPETITAFLEVVRRLTGKAVVTPPVPPATQRPAPGG